MIIYLIKLIIILVFNIGINTYYIYSECKCCCRSKQADTRSGGSKGNLSTNSPLGPNTTLGHNQPKGHKPLFGTKPIVTTHTQVKQQIIKIGINIDGDSIQVTNVAKETRNFTKIDKKTNTTNNIIHEAFSNLTNFYKFDGEIFNCITNDSEITITGVELSSYILFAVLTEGNKYYLGLCTDGSIKMHDKHCRGIFEGIKGNYDIKILGIGGNLNNFYSMFYECIDLKNVTFVKSVDTKNVTSMHSMFYGCSSLASLDLSSFDTSNVTKMISMFSGCSSLKELNLSSFNTDNVTDMNYMFNGCSSLEKLNLSNFNTSNVTDMDSMFSECSSLKELNLINFNTNNVTDMNSMFYGCKSLTSLDVSSFDTSNVTKMNDMFSGCSSLKKLNLSSFNTNNVTNMDNMFEGCGKLKGNVTTNDERIKSDYGEFIKED